MNLSTVLVFAYQDPMILSAVSTAAHWYKEGKILQSDSSHVIALRDGYRVQYNVFVYKFRKVPYTERELNKLIEMIKVNRDNVYTGWIHHANVYEKLKGEKSGRFLKSITLNFDT